MRIKSYAKINLILKVLPKKGELHPIFTLTEKINLYDEIDIKFNNTGLIKTNFSISSISRTNNTVIKAIQLLKNETKFKQGVEVYIKKNIPVESGLGGGSSNAATVLNYIISKLKINISSEKLKKIALEVGSDVPMFLTGGTTLVSGFGEKVESIKVKDVGKFLIVKPNFGISSKDAYKYFDSFKTSNKISYSNLKKSIITKPLYEVMTNDLELPIIRNVNKIKKVYKDLAPFKFKRIMMSGSGSSIIAFSDDLKLLTKAKKQLSSTYQFISINHRIKTR